MSVSWLEAHSLQLEDTGSASLIRLQSADSADIVGFVFRKVENPLNLAYAYRYIIANEFILGENPTINSYFVCNRMQREPIF